MTGRESWPRDALRALAVLGVLVLMPTPRVLGEPNPSAARGRIAQAKIALEQDDADAADDKLREAEDFVEGASDADKKAIYAAIDELKATLPAHRKAARDAKACGSWRRGSRDGSAFEHSYLPCCLRRCDLDGNVVGDGDFKFENAECRLLHGVLNIGSWGTPTKPGNSTARNAPRGSPAFPANPAAGR